MDNDRVQVSQPVYAIYEYRSGKPDSLVHVFEDDADTVSDAIQYYAETAESNSRIVQGRFHAANPGERHLSPGDHYLTKEHGVSISSGLDFGD